MNQTQDVIVLNTSRYGGICDYLHCQANAMSELGAKVTMVGVEGTKTSSKRQYDFLPLWKEPKVSKNRLVRQLLFTKNLLSNTRQFAKFLQVRPERNVLFGGFFEYLSPMWAWRFRGLKNQKRFATVIHDPVRDYIVGPEWWHQRSIAAAYSFNDIGFVHGPTDVVTDAGDLKLLSVPIGLFPFPTHKQTGSELRDSLGVPREAVVLLSFGHIRDGKNLDRVIEAMVAHPEVHLIVAGKAQSSGQKPAEFYIELADKLDVRDRCHFEVRFIDDEEVGSFHEAADVIALTYSSDFRSASAALGACINYRKPCIASSGAGPLKDAIENYNLGVWVQPDSTATIQSGLTLLLSSRPSPNWERYEAENSWLHNAKMVLNAFSKIES
jgi:glycosyltransferase involved in cell wall biosynthesis